MLAAEPDVVKEKKKECLRPGHVSTAACSVTSGSTAGSMWYLHAMAAPSGQLALVSWNFEKADFQDCDAYWNEYPLPAAHELNKHELGAFRTR